MRVDEAEGRLHQLLRDAGIDPERPEFDPTWIVFEAFCLEAVEAASDGVLVQVGIFDFYGPERFTVDFLRQFQVLGDDEEHDHFEQLHCEFLYEPDDELRSLGTLTEWWWPGDDQDLRSFMATMRSRPEVASAAGRTPVEARVGQEVV